jgi:hypothetical protein
MATARTGSSRKVSQAVPRAADWEMVSSFMLSLPENRLAGKECLLEPVALALKPFGIEEPLLCEISADIERTGEEMRNNCPEGRMKSVNVRVLVSRQALRSAGKCQQPWCFYILKQIASSESDNLDALENPRCYIDLHVHQAG